MNERKNLLSIGEMAKYTGAGIKALRYYDRINILKPAYVDPETERRYYSFNQTYLVELIKFCVELDVPLKELSEFIDGQETINLQDFLSHGKEAALKKMAALEKGLQFINCMEEKIISQEDCPLGQIYTREHPEKIFYVMPCEKTFDNVGLYDLAKSFIDAPFYEDSGMLEYGFLYEYSPTVIHRHVFAEVPQDNPLINCITIPAGNYYCKQSDNSLIEQSVEVFKGYLSDGDSFIAIETEVFSSKLNINKPLNELRVIAL